MKTKVLTHPYLQKTLAEAVGTFALVFFGCGSLMVIERFPDSLSPAAVPLIFGLVVASMIYALGHISGAHFNPAVTLAFAVARHFPVRQILFYWFGQISGALLAIISLKLILPDGLTYGATLPQISTLSSLGTEIILTASLMFVIVSVATDTRAVGTMAGAAIGSIITVAAFVGGPISGASMNPARSLAPAIFENELSSLWIYILGPILGAVAAALLYEFIRCEETAEDEHASAGCC